MSQYHYLYVEDDPLNREVMQTLLRDVIGVGRLTIFEDSSNFMTRIKQLDPLPDFVLLDMQVAPHNGHAMIAMLRGDDVTKHLKALAVSAGIMNNAIEHYQNEGFDGAISKPLDLRTFPEIIRRLENGEVIWQTS